MAVASVTPRVRTIVVCDDVAASPTEDGVFTLGGVRQHLEAGSFPWHGDLSLFLILSSPRSGPYAGKILVVNERSNKAVRYVKFVARFEEDDQVLPLYVEIVDCVFPEPGGYSFEVYFSARDGGEALKGELPFTVLSVEA